MANRNVVPLPKGWTSLGHARYEHENRAIVERNINPDNGIIEWCVLTVDGEVEYTGQDMHSAFAVGAGG